MTRTLQITGLLGAIVVIAFLFAHLFTSLPAKAAAGALPATIYSQTLVNASSTPGLVIATSTVCADRVVSTASSSVMIQFTEAFGGTPSAVSGVQQAGSSTVVYDASQYGCGAMRIYSFSNQVVTVLTAN